MKRILLTALFSFTLTLASMAQSHGDDWTLGIGVNAVNNLGTRNPVERPSDWAFKIPVSVSLEKSWAKPFSIEILLGLNEFSQKEAIDNAILTKDYTYFSADTNLKYYFGNSLLNLNSNRFDLFVTAGPGLFIIDNTNITGNLGGGALFWFSDQQKAGLKLQALSKFAMDAKDRAIDNNHFQYHLQVVFRL